MNIFNTNFAFITVSGDPNTPPRAHLKKIPGARMCEWDGNVWKVYLTFFGSN